MATRFGLQELAGYLEQTPRDAGPQDLRVRTAMREYLMANSGELGDLPGAELAGVLWRERERFAVSAAAGGEVRDGDRGSVMKVVNETLRAAGEPNSTPVTGFEMRDYVNGLYERAAIDGGDELIALRRVARRLNQPDLKSGDSREMVVALRDERAELDEGLTAPQRQAMTGVINHLGAVRTDPAPMRDPRGQDVVGYAKQRLARATGDEWQAIVRAVELMEEQPGLMAATDLTLRAEFLDQPLDPAATYGLTPGEAEALRGFVGDLASKTETPAVVTSRTTGTDALRAEVRRVQEAEGGAEVAAGAAAVSKFTGAPGAEQSQVAGAGPAPAGTHGARERPAVRTRATGTVRSND